MYQGILWNHAADREHELILEVSQTWVNLSFCSINLLHHFNARAQLLVYLFLIPLHHNKPPTRMTAQHLAKEDY